MFKINEYSVVSKKIDEVVLFPSAMMEKLDSMGLAANGIMKVSSVMELEMTDDDKAVAQTHLDHIVNVGIEYAGRHYTPFFAGSSDIRKGSSVWIDKSVYAEIGKWAMCGLQTKNLNIAVNKYAAYIGLLMSSTRKFEDVYGKQLDVHRVCVVKDSSVIVSGAVDYVDGGKSTKKNDHSVEINAFDGAAYIRPEMTAGKASTLRAPWVKAMAIPMDYIRFAEERGLSTIIKDYWENDVDLREIDLILTESCFKMAGQYENFAQYQAAFVSLGHEIRVCVEEHAPRKKAMPYQQHQTLIGATDEDAMKLAYMTWEHMSEFKNPEKTGGLIGGALGQATKIYSGLLVEPYTARLISEAYTAKRNRALGGKVFDLGYNAFLAPDPVAMLEALYGLPVKGVLKAGECCCAPTGRGWIDITRNPHLDHAHCLLYAVSIPNDYFVGPTLYLNIWDLTTIRLRADYDGDHVWYSRNSFLLNAVRKTDKILKNLPVDWVAPKAPKTSINRANLAQFFSSLTQASQIGIYADNFTKFWAWMAQEIEEDRVSLDECREVWCWLTWAGNVLIDAAKHGAANVKSPELVRYFSKMPLPAFCEHAKANNDRPLGSEHWQTRVAKSNGIVDKYAECIQKNVDEELHINGSEGFVFDPYMMLNDAHRKVGPLAGLYARGTRIPGTELYEGEGFFQKLAFMHAPEMEALRFKDLHTELSWEAERGKIMFQQIKLWAEERGSTIEAAYDIIARGVFSRADKTSEKWAYAMKRTFWCVFGEMAISAILNNQGAEALEAGIPEIDELDLSEDNYDEE